MVPGLISQKIVVAKLDVITEMLRGVESLPLGSFDEFSRDVRMIAAGESFLRRTLEALLDLGRHVLAKGFGLPVAEYAAIAERLGEKGVLPAETAAQLKLMAGYRNRMVHEYDVVTPIELYGILTDQIAEIVELTEAVKMWLAEHPERMDRSL